MGGNTTEYTTELNPNTSEIIVLRGGDYNYHSAPGGRYDYYASDAFPTNGFRATLFLK